MSETKYQKTEICRICLKNIINGRYIQIQTALELQDQGGSKTYRHIFEICTNYVITMEEPQAFCRICVRDLLNVYKFRRQCDKTQQILQSKIKLEIKTETIREDLNLSDDIKLVTEEEEDRQSSDYQLLEEFNEKRENNITGNVENEVLSNITTNNLKSDENMQKFVPTDSKNKKDLNLVRAKCEYCTASYKHRANLSTHYKIAHTDKKTNKCVYCKKLFYTTSLMESHKKICHERPDRNRICPVCGKQSNSNHIFYHTQKQAQRELTTDGNQKGCYICDLCGASVQTRYSMINHMKAQHFNEKLKCKYCDAEFRYPSYLTIHIQTIHQHKPIVYKCGKCGFIASTGSQLRKHRIIHSGKKPFTCSVCNYECYIRLEFENHKASHSDVRPHACEICGAAFKTKKTLRVHKTTHTGYEYECPVCQKSYLTNHLMRMHVEKIHPEYNLPPPGTVFSKTALKRLAEKEKRKLAMRSGSISNVQEINSINVKQ